VTKDLAVTIPPELAAQSLRYHQVEKWPVGTIAKQLRVPHTTVSRVLLQAGLPRILQPPKRAKVDPFLPFIRATLERFPTLTASRLYAMVRERGYPGLLSLSKGGPRPAYRRLPSAAAGGGSLSAPAHLARRAGAGRLGPLWPCDHRAGAPAADGLCHGAE
jgi:hypothetical protein